MIQRDPSQPYDSRAEAITERQQSDAIDQLPTMSTIQESCFPFRVGTIPHNETSIVIYDGENRLVSLLSPNWLTEDMARHMAKIMVDALNQQAPANRRSAIDEIANIHLQTFATAPTPKQAIADQTHEAKTEARAVRPFRPNPHDQ